MTSDDLQFPQDGEVSRTALDEALQAEFRQRILETTDWQRFTLARHRRGRGAGRESLRPLMIRDAVCWQLERVDAGRTTVSNIATITELTEALERLLQETGPREYHLQSTSGDLHVRVTRKGRTLVARGQAQTGAAPVAPPPHDRVKRQPLTQFDATALLRITGIGDAHGGIRASMRGKYDQINAFLRELETALPDKPSERPLEIVDCGSGLAYLTLAATIYLQQVHGLDVRVHGIHRNATLVGKANALARDLDLADKVTFIAADLADCTLDVRPDLLLSLHACDAATDLALARGVEWGAATMLVAPCCQHDLQRQLRDSGPMRALLRHNILRERQADLLTDAFRAQLLRMLGYRVRIVEFVAPEATARNLLLRATAGLARGQGMVVEEYLALRDFWRVTPILEELLAPRLGTYLGTPAASGAEHARGTANGRE